VVDTRNLFRSGFAVPLTEFSSHDMNRSDIGRPNEVCLPTLVIVGSRDVPDIHWIADLLIRDIPGARKVVIEGAGHMVNLEEPGRLNGIVLGFFEGPLSDDDVPQLSFPDP
jgi:pimeloyl-ACP methyl ester carboxylesterase